MFARGFSGSSDECVFCTFQAIYFCPGDTLAANSLQTERRTGTESIKSARGSQIDLSGRVSNDPREVDRDDGNKTEQTNKHAGVWILFYDG